MPTSSSWWVEKGGRGECRGRLCGQIRIALPMCYIHDSQCKCLYCICLMFEIEAGLNADVKEEDAPDSAAKTEEDNEDIVKKEEENGSHAVKEEVDEAVKEDPQIKEDPQMKEEAGTLVKGELGSQKPASKKNRNRKKV